MNHSVSGPPPVPEELSPSSEVWYFVEEGSQRGPVSEANLGRRLASKELAASTFVWHPNQRDWLEASDAPALTKYLPQQSFEGDTAVTAVNVGTMDPLDRPVSISTAIITIALSIGAVLFIGWFLAQSSDSTGATPDSPQQPASPANDVSPSSMDITDESFLGYLETAYPDIVERTTAEDLTREGKAWAAMLETNYRDGATPAEAANSVIDRLAEVAEQESLDPTGRDFVTEQLTILYTGFVFYTPAEVAFDEWVEHVMDILEAALL